MAKEMTETELILALKGLNDRWPKTHWLFAANGDLHLMKYQPDGDRKMLSNGGVDPTGAVCDFPKIRCDGGDW